MSDHRVVVVVEDDRDIRDLLEHVLSQSGFDVHCAETGRSAIELVRAKEPSIVTLDLGLPDIDGFEVARRLRTFSDAYILMLTARENERDTVEGFAVGADDYLTKPFRPRELRARVDGMLRRARPSQGVTLAPPKAVSGGERLEHKGLVLDGSTRTASIEGLALELTRTEFDLLRIMLESGKRARTKAELARRLRLDEYDTGGNISEAAERVIEVHMGNLRRKMGDDSRSPRWLKTVRGVGYGLT